MASPKSDAVATPTLTASRDSIKPEEPIQPEQVRLLENGLLDVTHNAVKFAEITSRNARESPLLRLPAELRSHIFNFALGGRTIDIRMNPDTRVFENRTKSKNAHALLQVSRQIYDEASHVPFKSNIISFRRMKAIHGWLDTLMPGIRNKITHLQYDAFISKWSWNEDGQDGWDFHELSALRNVHIAINVHDGTGKDRQVFLDLVEKEIAGLKKELEGVKKSVKITVEKNIRFA